VDEFDTARWLWLLPAERSKSKRERVTPIVGLAREIIARRLELTKGSLFVAATGRPLSSMNVGHLLLNNPPPINKFGTHDLRRTVATMMAEALGISLETIARVIGHTAGTSASTRTLVAHYLSSQFVAEKTNALLAWDARLRAIINGDAVPAMNVFSLAKRPA
jgi:integrase